MKKGIFWYCNTSRYGVEEHIIPVFVECNIDGTALEDVEFSSKSGTNFNHKKEWSKRNSEYPYNYYPRGRVEIRKGKIKVFANPVIIEDEDAKRIIIDTFELLEFEDQIIWIPDGSTHYKYLAQFTRD
ncbi:hypothetical protein [Pseudobutyrivibrio ruminis]|uniref:Uncharacterized protein n=1 Tax=Pseudobutyrivibrio ruminis DSM 9787 TaxID=1123011 RepID=A0A285SJG8_9FIRM|nr:hypothetical protein [Pseudobutyrivibrio ruminis]SOC08082.1 hypothetical protein SAMN02910411_2409 [Pseudobutyrivibrio ruminis DSM 9787]